MEDTCKYVLTRVGGQFHFKFRPTRELNCPLGKERAVFQSSPEMEWNSEGMTSPGW